MGTLLSIGTVGVGFFARSLGAIILSHFGDRLHLRCAGRAGDSPNRREHPGRVLQQAHDRTLCCAGRSEPMQRLTERNKGELALQDPAEALSLSLIVGVAHRSAHRQHFVPLADY